MKAGKAVASGRKELQAKEKALPVETVNSASQTDHAAEEVKMEVVDVAT